MKRLMPHLWKINLGVGVGVAGIGGFLLADGKLIGLTDIAVAALNIGIAVFNFKRARRASGSDRGTEANRTYTEAGEGAEHMGNASGISINITGGGSFIAPISPAAGAVALESVEQAEPIRAWRGVQLLADEYTVALQAMNHMFGGFAADEQKASCRRSYNYGFNILSPQTKPDVHEAPGLNCECGFYGVKDKADAYGPFIAEADFYGTVIEHELGYRAEYQRILSVRVVAPYCSAGFLCEGKPERVVFPPSPRLMVVNGQGTTVASVNGEPVVPNPAPACASCASKFERSATLRQIAARLGVEVRWDS